MTNNSAKSIAQQSISQGISRCSDFISQPHVEHLAKQSVIGILDNLATAGQAIHGIIEDKDDISNILERLCDISVEDDREVNDLLISMQDFHLTKLLAASNLSIATGIISEHVAKEAFSGEDIDADELKVTIGRALRAIAVLCRENDIKISDCITTVINSMTIKRAAD